MFQTQKEGSGRGLNPGPLASDALGVTLSENHTTRPPDQLWMIIILIVAERRVRNVSYVGIVEMV